MKASFLTVKFEVKWILANQISGKSLIVEDVLKALKEKYADSMVVIIDKEFHQCSVIVASDADISADEISALLKTKVAAIDEANVGVEVEEADEQRLTQLLEEVDLSETEREFFKKEFHITFEKSEAKETSEGAETINIDELIGLEPLKKWIGETEKMSGRFKDVIVNTKVMQNIVHLISINRGNGLSTVLNLMAQTLSKNGLVEFNGDTNVVEWKLSYSEDPRDFCSFQGLLDLVHRLENRGRCFKGIISLDMEEWLDNLSDKRLDVLLNYVWDNKDDIIFVFTIPYVENSVMEKLYDRIDDVISVRTMKFVPPSDEQYFEYFKKTFAKYDISVQEDAYGSFISKITAEKNDGKFYGFNTVKKIVNEILYNVIAEAAKTDGDITTEISSGDFERIYGIEDSDGLSGIEQLNGMVALYDVKNKVREILSTVKLQKEMYSQGGSAIRPCFHMMFTGNPGTGKTVVARIIGRIFKEEGLLQVGNFFEVSRKDFIGKFVGHTAPKTMEICRNAYGSVLFIDEAYMLADNRDGYSSEAIGTLIAEMENNRDKMVVIFAGYEKELENLFDMNPGLRDRIPYKIDFPNYNRDELKQIFFIQLNNKMKYDASFEQKADEFFKNFPDDVLNRRDFSNGRFVRNLAERIVSKAALRFEMADVDIENFELTENDFAVAESDTDFQKLFNKVKHVKTIGF